MIKYLSKLKEKKKLKAYILSIRVKRANCLIKIQESKREA